MQGVNLRVITKERTSFTELLDNREGIILDLENLHYFTLNGSAVFIWKLMRNGCCHTIDELAARLGSAFDLRVEQASVDIRSFINQLKAQGLVSFSEGSAESKGGPGMTPNIDNQTLPAYDTPCLMVSESLAHVTLSGSSTIATAAIATGGTT